MAKYKRKSSIVEAFQWTGHDLRTNPKWFLEAQKKPSDQVGAARIVNNDLVKMITGTPEHPVMLTAYKNDFIVKGEDGLLFAIKPDVFHKLHDEA